MRVKKYQDGCWRIEVNRNSHIKTFNPPVILPMCCFTTLRIEGQHVKTKNITILSLFQMFFFL